MNAKILIAASIFALTAAGIFYAQQSDNGQNDDMAGISHEEMSAQE